MSAGAVLDIVRIGIGPHGDKLDKDKVKAGEAPLMHKAKVFLDLTLTRDGERFDHIPDPADVIWQVVYDGKLDLAFTGSDMAPVDGRHFDLTDQGVRKLAEANGMACIIRLTAGEPGTRKAEVLASVTHPDNGQRVEARLLLPVVD